MSQSLCLTVCINTEICLKILRVHIKNIDIIRELLHNNAELFEVILNDRHFQRISTKCSKVFSDNNLSDVGLFLLTGTNALNNSSLIIIIP